jgi:hypothetical protein
MRLRFSQLLISLGSLGFVLGLGMLPAQAQVSNGQVAALVEALRQAAPQTGDPNDGLYSDWQIMGANIPRWSRSCLGRELTPSQFEADPNAARSVVTCVMRDVLQDEYRASNNNELLAVRRSAAWWMRGDPEQYNSAEISDYVQRVVTAYQQQEGRAAAAPTQPAQPAAQTQRPPQTSDYDRYMQAGYAATQARDFETALLYFRRALDERPDDSYAEEAIENVEDYQDSRAQ